MGFFYPFIKFLNLHIVGETHAEQTGELKDEFAVSNASQVVVVSIMIVHSRGVGVRIPAAVPAEFLGGSDVHHLPEASGHFGKENEAFRHGKVFQSGKKPKLTHTNMCAVKLI